MHYYETWLTLQIARFGSLMNLDAFTPSNAVSFKTPL
jgi:hypothetical protein